MSLKQLKSLFDAQKYLEVLQAADAIIAEQGTQNKAAFMFLAQAQIELNMLADGQETLNELYGVLQLGQNKNDDTLYSTALQWNAKLARRLQEAEGASRQDKARGREVQKQNQFKIVEYFDYARRDDKMVAEMETFMQLLAEDELWKEVENNLVWLLEHPRLTAAQKLGYAARIPTLNEFYRPYTSIEKLFGIMANLQGMQRPFGPEMTMVAGKLLEHFERQTWRKDLHSALDRLGANKGALDEFQRYCKSAVPAAEIVFAANPPQVLFGGDASALTHFLRAIFHKTFSLQLGTEEWRAFIADLGRATQLEVF